MADVSRDPREHWLKPHFSKNEVANSGSDGARVKFAAAPRIGIAYASNRDQKRKWRFTLKRGGGGSSEGCMV